MRAVDIEAQLRALARRHLSTIALEQHACVGRRRPARAAPASADVARQREHHAGQQQRQPRATRRVDAAA